MSSDIAELVERLRAGKLLQPIKNDSPEVRCDDALYLEAADALVELQSAKTELRIRYANDQATIARLEAEKVRLQDEVDYWKHK